MKNLLKKQAGTSILEFLLVMPVLLLLAFTAIEFGAVFTRANTITKSVQQATRYLSAEHDLADTADEINVKKTIATNLIIYASFNNTGDSVLPEDAGINLGFVNPSTFITTRDTDLDGIDDHVRIAVVYMHQPVGGQTVSNLLQLITGTPVDLSFPLRASSVMRYTQ